MLQPCAPTALNWERQSTAIGFLHLTGAKKSLVGRTRKPPAERSPPGAWNT